MSPRVAPQIPSALSPQITVHPIDEIHAPPEPVVSLPRWDQTPVYLDNIFGKTLGQIPIIGVLNGATDYLDMVRPKDFVDANGQPVCMAKGTDPYGRHFVSMGIKITQSNTKQTEHHIYTLFRRYTDRSSQWVMCKSHYSQSPSHVLNSLFGYSMTMTDVALGRLKELVTSYNHGNIGILLTAEVFDHTTHKYVNREYLVSLYPPYTDTEIE